jgi:hypothetical protein
VADAALASTGCEDEPALNIWAASLIALKMLE